jgi:thiamine pyrophosphate-dependent acetolactate synthase large subunit-like protein
MARLGTKVFTQKAGSRGVAEPTEAPLEEVPEEGKSGRPLRLRPLKIYRERLARRRAERAAERRRSADLRKPPPPDATLEQKIDYLNARMAQMRFAEYMAMWENPRRMFWVNLVSGMGRGLGYGIGIAFLTGVAIYILQKLIAANLPYISDWLATIIQLVDQKVRP